MPARKITYMIRGRTGDPGFHHSLGAQGPMIPTSGVTMLRSIQSTAFLGTLLLTGAAVAAEPSTPASDENVSESGKPENSPATPAPSAAKDSESKQAPVAAPAPSPPAAEPQAAATPTAARKSKSVDSAGLSSQSLTYSGGTETSETAMAVNGITRKS